jgi:parallel beta-helix repeat protein
VEGVKSTGVRGGRFDLYPYGRNRTRYTDPVAGTSTTDRSAGVDPSPYGDTNVDPPPPTVTEPPGSPIEELVRLARNTIRLLLGSWLVRFGFVFLVLIIASFGFASDGFDSSTTRAGLADEVLEPMPVPHGAPRAALVAPVPAEAAGPAEPAGPTAPVIEQPLLEPNPFFVSPSLGDDANPGTSMDQPWASLKNALRRLEPGHTLYLMDGTYSEVDGNKLHYVSRQSGTPDAWIHITAAPGHNPELVATIGSAIEIHGSYTEISNLRVRGEGFDESNSFGYGINARRAHHVRINDNVISNMPLAGISAIESSNIEILNNEVFENARWSSSQGSGISVWHSLDWDQPPAADGYHDRIIGNRVYRNENRVKSKWKNYTTITDGNGIIIDENRDFNYTGRTLVANNVVFDNGGRAIMVFKSNRVDVIFNTTYNNGWTDGLEGGPVELAVADATDVRVVNNMAWALPGAPALAISRANETESQGNVLVTTSSASFAGPEDLQLTVDPGIVNPSTDENQADFRPEPTGVLADKAIQWKPMLPYDVDGNPRVAGSADVGAYEIDLG